MSHGGLGIQSTQTIQEMSMIRRYYLRLLEREQKILWFLSDIKAYKGERTVQYQMLEVGLAINELKREVVKALFPRSYI